MLTLILILLFFTHYTKSEILESNLGPITLTSGLRARFYQVQFDGTESSNDRKAFLNNKNYLTKGKYLGEVKHVTSLDTNYVKYTSPYIYGFHIDPSVDQFVIELRGYYKPDSNVPLRMTSTVYGSKGCTEKVEPSILSPFIKASNAVYLNQINSEQICYQNNAATIKFATLYNEVSSGTTSGMAVTGGSSTPIFIANNYYPIRIVLLSRGSALLSFFYLRDGANFISFSSKNIFSNDSEDYDAMDDNINTEFPGNCPQFSSNKMNSKRGVSFDDSERLVKRDDCPVSSSSEISTSTSEIVTSSSEVPMSSSQIVTSSSEIFTSSSEIITSSSEIPASSSEVITSSSEVPTSSSETPTSPSETIMSSSEVWTSSTSDMVVSSETATSSELIPTSTSEIVTYPSDIISSSVTIDPIPSITSNEPEPVHSSTSYVLSSDTSDIVWSSTSETISSTTSDPVSSTSTNGATDIITSNIITTITDGHTITKTCTVCQSSKDTTSDSAINQQSKETPLHPTTTSHQLTESTQKTKTAIITYVTTNVDTPTTIITVTKYPVSSNYPISSKDNDISQFPTIIQSTSIAQTRSSTIVKPTASLFSTFEGQGITLTFRHIWCIAILLLV